MIWRMGRVEVAIAYISNNHLQDVSKTVCTYLKVNKIRIFVINYNVAEVCLALQGAEAPYLVN
jgi:hypothetical protein